MADAAVLGGTRSDRFMDRVRTIAGVLAAVAGAITGLWTIYEKVKSDARQYTAASYETLAPQMNQMAEALKTLEQQNAELRQALVAHGERPRAPTHKPAAKPGEPPTPPTAPGAPSGAAAATAPATAAPAEEPDDALGRLAGTLQQTRAAVDAVRKVPETFQKVLDQKGKK
jgi:hypothetical protein